MTDFWDNPDIGSGEYVKMNAPGDIAQGTITGMRVGTWFNDPDERPSVRIWMDCPDGENRHLTASYVGLAKKLQELRPAVGDQLYVKYVSKDKHPTDKAKNLSTFDVRVKKGTGQEVWDDPKAKSKPVDDSDEPPF